MNIFSRPRLLKIISAACFLLLPLAVTGQTRHDGTLTKVPEKPAQPVTQVTSPAIEPTPTPEAVKKNLKTNSRPVGSNAKIEPGKQISKSPAYFYEFARPEFLVSKVVIEHDEDGNGRISFQKKDVDELLTDPLIVSPTALKRINDALTTLNFLDSTENYQYEKDYSHLGNITIRINKNGKERTAKFNWTLNKDAKVLMDEYRKIGNQYVWKFDITVARELQPLNAPRLMDEFDDLMRRNEISDPRQMLPFLKELANDERIPLIARNHAAKLSVEIEKAKN